MTVFGTRPEAIKMGPLVQALNAHPEFESVLCVTGQHREMLDQVLDIFNLTSDYDLDIMKPGQSLSHVTSKILLGLEPILKEETPDWVLVHGDTSSTAAAALAAYYQRIAVGHVEAGLRTHDIYSPWPEEVNRKITGVMTACHFAPTEKAKGNLLAENVDPETIVITGNTVVDALFSTLKQLEASDDLRKSIVDTLPALDPQKKLILVTGHRRESFGVGFENICNALLELSQRDDVQIIYPVHLNPYVKKIVSETLSGQDNIHLIEPLDYVSFLYLMTKSSIIITDSGGIQEEAPSLGIPVLVTRETTERPEALKSGSVKLVGQDKQLIVDQTSHLLDDAHAYKTMSEASNPYGDGKAVDRILAHLLTRLDLSLIKVM